MAISLLGSRLWILYIDIFFGLSNEPTPCVLGLAGEVNDEAKEPGDPIVLLNSTSYFAPGVPFFISDIYYL